jgi:hypothetical protein
MLEYKLETTFFINQKKVEDVKFYTIRNNEAFELEYVNNTLLIPIIDFKNEFLLVHDGVQVKIFLENIESSYQLIINCENGIFNRKIRRLKFRYIFKCIYQFDQGFDYVSTVFKSKNKINLK